MLPPLSLVPPPPYPLVPPPPYPLVPPPPVPPQQKQRDMIEEEPGEEWIPNPMYGRANTFWNTLSLGGGAASTDNTQSSLDMPDDSTAADDTKTLPPYDHIPPNVPPLRIAATSEPESDY